MLENLFFFSSFSSLLPFLSIFFLFQSFFSFSHPFFSFFVLFQYSFFPYLSPLLFWLFKDICLKYSIIIYIAVLKNVRFQIICFQTLLIKKQFHILLVSVLVQKVWYSEFVPHFVLNKYKGVLICSQFNLLLILIRQRAFQQSLVWSCINKPQFLLTI